MKRKKTHRQLKNNSLLLLLLLMGIALLQPHTAYAQTKYEMTYNNGGHGEYIQNTSVGNGIHWGVSVFANYGERLRIEDNLITAFPRIHAHAGVTTYGDVGIGTQTPSNIQNWDRVLDVHGAKHSKVLATTDSLGVETGIFSHYSWMTTNTPAGAVGTLTDYDFKLIAGGIEKVTIKTNGHVGIGTTTPDDGLGWDRVLNVYGTDHSKILATINSGVQTGLFSHSNWNGAVGVVGTQSNHDMRLMTNGNHHMTIKTGGNVGIGIEPEEKLHVNGAIRGNQTGGALRIQTQHGYTDVGVQNSLWSHFYTDAPRYYFNKGVSIDEGLIGSYDEDLQLQTSGTTRITVLNASGNVGIGLTPTEKLDVDGTVKATSFVSSAASFPDYVFAEDYKITPLAELETYVKTYRRLPNMPSEKEVVEQGLNLPEVLIKSVENIETIYLHLIRMEKESKAMKEALKTLQEENAALKQQLKQGR